MKLDSGFHKWAFSKGMNVRITNGEYSNSETKTQYECWQAARAEAFRECAEIARRYSDGLRENFVEYSIDVAAAIEARTAPERD